MMYKKVGFKTENFTYFVHLPDWFLKDRGDRGITFESLLRDSEVIPEIHAYKKMHEYMIQFSKEAVFLDVGAHMGLVSIPIAMEGYDVLAIEPVTYDMLSGNSVINGMDDFITILATAAYDEIKSMKIYVPTHDDCTSLSNELASVGDPVRAIDLKTVVLDDFLSKNNRDHYQERIRFIKIDVQGFEFNVLKGLKHTLSLPFERHVLIEWDESMMLKIGVDPGDINTFFDSLGFVKEQWDSGDALFIKKGESL